jgi:hypothetical protein
VPNVTAMTVGKRMRVGPRQKTKGDDGFTAISGGSVAFKFNARNAVPTGFGRASRSAALSLVWFNKQFHRRRGG